MAESVDTVIVGGGQAGLATSYHLTQRGVEHVVLEKADQPASAWRDNRWDTFTLVTPNWSFRLPGAEYEGPEPDGFMLRSEVITRFESYVDNFSLPVRFGAEVTSVEPRHNGRGFSVTTPGQTLEARSVAIATGLFQGPKMPPVRAAITPRTLQLHASQYRNPQSLPDGGVLVVGSAQSGCQIAEELYQHGRRVCLCLGGAGRVPRRYRGRDIFEWLDLIGFLDRTVEDLPSPRARFAASPHVSGRDGGHDLNLHTFARDGVMLLGHLKEAEGERLWLEPDVRKSLRRADLFETEMIRRIDAYIERSGLAVPSEPLLTYGVDGHVKDVENLDLAAEGIGTIIWATGFSFDFGLVKAPVLDADGYPHQQRGVTGVPGLYFVGMPWLDRWKSGLLFGVGEHAAYIASEIARPSRTGAT